MGVKFGKEEGTFGPLLRAKFHPHRCNVWPLRGENLQNRPLSKLNNRHFALRAMLPVNKCPFIKLLKYRAINNTNIRHAGRDTTAAMQGSTIYRRVAKTIDNIYDYHVS